MSYWFAVAVSQKRRAEWHRVFGAERVPVMQGRPRWVEFRDGPGWGYDVAVGRLHHGQRARLAGHIGRVNRVPYVVALRMVDDGVVVRADGLIIETADAIEYRPFVFERWPMARRAERSCRVANCPGVAVGSDYCDEHAMVKRATDERSSSSSRGYGYRWQRQRRMILHRNPLCADPFGVHSDNGVVELATDVHHVIPLSSNAPTNVVHSDGNMMALCHSCHSRITMTTDGTEMADDGGGGQPVGGEGDANTYRLQKLDRRPSYFIPAASIERGG